MKKHDWSRQLHRWGVLLRDAEVYGSLDPRRIGRRLMNQAVNRKLVRPLFRKLNDWYTRRTK